MVFKNLNFLFIICLSSGIGHEVKCLPGIKPSPPPEPTCPLVFQSSPIKSLHENFIRKAIDSILAKGIFESNKLETLPFLNPQEIQEKLDITLQENGVGEDKLIEIIEALFEVMPKPAQINRMSTRVAGLDPLALIGDWMAATMSNIVITYLDAPIYTFMEITLTKYLSSQIGWWETGEGVPTTGAGSANSMAMAVALRELDPNVRDIGLFHMEKPLKIFISKDASISWKTAVIYDGVGLNGVVEVPTDIYGKMDPVELDKLISAEIEANRKPLMVVATAGTPTLGAIDPIDHISSICAKYKVWLHVDAELAGGYLFTNKKTHFHKRLCGIDRADSVTMSMWLFQAPYPNSMLLTRKPTALHKTFSLHAPYVFEGNDLYNMSYDRGDHTVQTSRRPEVGKIWFAAARGEDNICAMFEQMEQTRKKFLEMLKTYESFIGIKMSTDPEAHQVPLVSFYYEPQAWKGRNSEPEYVTEISRVSKHVVSELRRQGLLDISLSTLQNEPELPLFFTISFTNTRLSSKFLEFIFTQISEIGEGRISPAPFPDIDLGPQDLKLAYPNYPSKDSYGLIFKEILDLAFATGIFFNREDSVLNFKQPEFFESSSNFDFSFPTPGDENLFEKLIASFKALIEYSPHFSHPYYIYHLDTGIDPYTTIADYIAPLLNTPMINYYDSAPFMLMERELVKQLLKRVYRTETGDGTISDGGSMGNQMAIAMAKYHRDKEGYKFEGIGNTKGAKYIVYISSDSHYSTTKGSILQGIGQNNTITVEANDIGQMRVDKLRCEIEKTLKEGNIPLMVVITTGTTIYGAIDPIHSIVEVCQKYGIWCHADGAFGGLLAMSDEQIKKFKGLEGTDSWSADLHKLMGSTMISTILLTRHPDYLLKTFQVVDGSSKDLLEEDPNLSLAGRHTQLDKRNNVFKFWFLWKAKGRKGFGAHADKIIANKDYLVSEIKRRENDGFELVLDNFDLTNVCFRYIPPVLNPKINPEMDRNSKEWKEAMNRFAVALEHEFIRNQMILFVTQSRLEASGSYTVKFIKFVMMRSSLTQEDIRYMLDSVRYYGNQIEKQVVGRSGVDVLPGIRGFDAFGNLPKYYRVI